MHCSMTETIGENVRQLWKTPSNEAACFVSRSVVVLPSAWINGYASGDALDLTYADACSK